MRFSIFLLLMCLCLKLVGGTLTRVDFEHDGINRKTKVFVPDNYDGSLAYPLLISNHGGAYTVDEWIDETTYNRIAERDSFIVVYPEGVQTPFFGNAWNVGYGPSEDVDDIGFLDQVIAYYSTTYNVDQSKIFMGGYSQGGMLSYKYACERPGVLRAIASGSGSMSADIFNNCEEATGLPVMHIHGTADFIVPYGGVIGTMTSVTQTIEFWRGLNGCGTERIVTLIPNNSLDGIGDVRRFDYTCDLNYLCDNTDNELVLYRLNSGYHGWYNGDFNDIDNNEITWAFFKKQCRNAVVTSSEEIALEQTIQIFPNPTSSNLYIRLGESLKDNISLYSVMGSLVISKMIQNELSIDVRNIPAGLYVVEVSNENNRFSKIVTIE